MAAASESPDACLKQGSSGLAVTDFSRRVCFLIASREVNGRWVSCAPGAGVIAQADSRETSVQKAEDLILDEIEDCLQAGDPVPQAGFFRDDITRDYSHVKVAVFELGHR